VSWHQCTRCRVPVWSTLPVNMVRPLFCYPCHLLNEERRRFEQHRNAGPGGAAGGPGTGEGATQGGGPGEAPGAGEDTGVRVPDLAEPIVAYRVWAREGRLLASTVGPIKGSFWPDGEPLKAECRVRNYGLPPWLYLGPAPVIDLNGGHDGPSPDLRCGCGIYAHKTLNNVVLAMEQLRVGHTILGEALLWGRVFEHQDGWRAEYARTHRLYRLWEPELEPRMTLLAHAYGVEIVEPPPSLVVVGVAVAGGPFVSMAQVATRTTLIAAPPALSHAAVVTKDRPRRRWGKVAAGVGLWATYTVLGIFDLDLWVHGMGALAVGGIAGTLIGRGMAGK
jgi:hypothetical protein